ncbi:MAG: hypothetical protein QOF00_4481 [Pseudonocardiales bacterium]|nr:hypothetical protein [Pseudonocardiales bacterium]
MFASEGDSVNVGRQASPSWEDRWGTIRPREASGGGDPRGGRDVTVGDDAAAGIARRLQARVDRHRWLLGRMRSDPLQPEPAGLPELLETVLRMRRDTESLLMLHGQDPGVRPSGSQRLSDVLAAAAAASEEPRRVDVRNPPAATVAPAAATELLHVLAEVVDHVAAVYPGARVDVSCRVESPGGIAVEIRADGATRHDPEGLGGRRALGAAERLAQRSLSGIALRTPPVGVTASGPVASIHCPGSVVTVEAAAAPDAPARRAPMSWTSDRLQAAPPRPEPDAVRDEPAAPRYDALFPEPSPAAVDGPPSGGYPLDGPPSGGHPVEPAEAAGSVEPLTPRRPDPLSDPLPLDPPGSVNGAGSRGASTSYDLPSLEPSALDLPVRDVPAYEPAARSSSPVDELFGPMLDLAHDPAEEIVATPIFEAIASAWFREPEPAGGAHGNRAQLNGSRNGAARHGGANGSANGNTANGNAANGNAANGDSANGTGSNGADDDRGGPRNWETPSDSEWRAAAERANRPEPEDHTSTGLPRRRPGNQLVPPPRRGAGVPEPERPERVPDRVRERLATYQRGLRQGRHRADPAPADADPGDPAAW